MIMLSVTIPQSNLDGQLLDQYLSQIASGDSVALGKLYEETSPAIYGFALSILKNKSDAEDILQDLYVRVYQSASTYRTKGKPMAWLLTMTRNLCLMRIREQKKTNLLPSDEIYQVYEQAVTDEDRMVLESLLKDLKDEERQIVVLHSLTGLKHREIASLLELPLPTVLSKYNRALKKLRNLL